MPHNLLGCIRERLEYHSAVCTLHSLNNIDAFNGSLLFSCTDLWSHWNGVGAATQAVARAMGTVSPNQPRVLSASAPDGSTGWPADALPLHVNDDGMLLRQFYYACMALIPSLPYVPSALQLGTACFIKTMSRGCPPTCYMTGIEGSTRSGNRNTPVQAPRERAAI